MLICEIPLAVFTVGDVIRKMRQERGWSIDDLKERANGVGKMTISAIERGRDARQSTLDRIAVAFGMKGAGDLFAMLRSDQPRQTSTEQSEYSEGDRDPDFDVEDGYRPDDLPVIAEGEATPRPEIFWDAAGKLLSSITERISRPAGLRDRHAYGVKVRNDSMVPVFRPGHYIVVSPGAPIADGDEVFVVMKTGAHLIKIARRVPNGWLLESANPTHPSRVVTHDEIELIHAIVWSRRKVPGLRIVDDEGRRK